MNLYKSIPTILSTMMAFSSLEAAPTELQHVHPLNWWCGMQDEHLQVMLHGENIGDCEVILSDAQGISIERVVRVENANYLFVYLNLQKAEAQTFHFCLTKPGQSTPYVSQPYELKERSSARPQPFGPQDVLYLLMPDRFVNGNHALDNVPGMMEPTVSHYDKKSNPKDDGRHGGDLAGIRQSLDYLQDLGITAIWPTPVQINDGPVSYHGYAITDYYQIDPRLGSNEEYRTLVADCHDKGIKMVMDLVFNHCGANNFLYRDLPQKDWFNFDSQFVRSSYRVSAPSDIHASQHDLKYTIDGWFDTNMPDWNQRNPLVKDYLIQASIWWVEYANLDGIRQDTYPYADREMMAEWNLRMEKEYPGFNIVGETWVNTAPGVAFWQKDSKLSDFNSQLKTVMDFPLMNLLNAVLDEESNDWNAGLSRLYDYIAGDLIYANPNYLLTFLGNHDTDRFASNKTEAQNIARYKQALTLLLTLRGIPQLYYGDEIGEFGNRNQGDGRLRQDMPLPEIAQRGYTKLQEEYHNFTRTLLQWRKGCKAIHAGALTQFGVSQGCYVYSRHLEGQRATILMNGTSHKVRLNLEQYQEVLPAEKAKDIVTGKLIKIGKTLTLEPHQVAIWEF